ncbi:MAG: FAD-dependent oxidoreductase [Candidatus Hydrogenedentes bacterium]|nr:FAD-dependent oxidoreductase [Candidatus Hydrogenedentota bacterium]
MASQTGTTVYRLKLTERSIAASQTLALKFEKPASFTFRPGQYLTLTLPDPLDANAPGESRTLSIASAPHENFLMVATRLRNTVFKQRLSQLELNSEVRIDGPGGSFAMDIGTAQTAVFVVGGIGITPVRSILVSAAWKELPLRTVLFYSNHKPEDALFLDELTDLQSVNPHYQLVASMTRLKESRQEWTGCTEHLSWELFAKHVADAISPVYYVVGPPRFVDSMRALLAERGVNPGNVRAEDFSGY